MRKIGRRAAWPLAAAALAAGLAGCEAGPRPVPRDYLRVNLGSEPPTLDPSLATDSVSFDVILNLFEGLVEFDPGLRPKPAAAESWAVEDGGRRFVFRLREGARWSDGVPVRASDFVYSWRRLLAPETASEYAYFLYEVEGAEAFNAGRSAEPDSVGVRAPDDRTLVVELRRAIVYFPMITAFMVTFPLRRDVIEMWGSEWTEPERIVTNGPFRLVEWRHEYRVVLEANPLYARGRPPLAGIAGYMVNESSTALTLFRMGKLDIVDIPSTDIPLWKSSPSYRHMPFLRSNYFGFNVTKPPFDDPRVRRAFGHAIDRAEIPRILKGGEIPVASWIPPGMFAHDPAIGLGFDPERARRLLAEAGYPGGRGFPDVTAAFNTNPDIQLVLENLQEQWKRNLGVRVTLANEEWKVYLKHLVEDAPQIFRLGWGADYPDPDNFMALFTSTSGNNHTNWGSAEFDRLVADAAAEVDPARREALYGEAQRILCESDAPIVPLFASALNMLVSGRVREFEPNAMDLLYLRGARVVPDFETSVPGGR